MYSRNPTDSEEMGRKYLFGPLIYVQKATKKQFEKIKTFYSTKGRELPGKIFASGKKIIENMPATTTRVWNAMEKLIEKFTKK